MSLVSIITKPQTKQRLRSDSVSSKLRHRRRSGKASSSSRKHMTAEEGHGPGRLTQSPPTASFPEIHFSCPNPCDRKPSPDRFCEYFPSDVSMHHCPSDSRTSWTPFQPNESMTGTIGSQVFPQIKTTFSINCVAACHREKSCFHQAARIILSS